MPPKVNRPRPGGSVDIVEVQGRPGAPADPNTLLEHVNPYEAPSRDDDGNLISLPVASKAGLPVNALDYGAIRNGAAPTHTHIQAAIDACSAGGGGSVALPAGTYLLGGPLTPKPNVTIAGPGAKILTNYTGNAIYGKSVAASNFAIEWVRFTGTFTGLGGVLPTVPSRQEAVPGDDSSRPVSGPGMRTAIQIEGSLDPNVSGGAVFSNLTLRGCVFEKLSGLPYILSGIDGISVTNCRHEYTMDAGFKYSRNGKVDSNVFRHSGDNGISVSRGCDGFVVSNNIVDTTAYYGIFAAGFSGDKGPTNGVITGNMVRNTGLGGIYLDEAPKYWTVSGNTLNGGYWRGPEDVDADSRCVGIFVGGFPSSDRANPTDYADGINVFGNTVKGYPRAGFYCAGGMRDGRVTNNALLDIGTQYLADGTTAILSSDLSQNVGILFDNPTTCSNVVVADNQVADRRSTPWCNWGIVPVGTSIIKQWNNDMVGCRNARNLQETGQQRDRAFLSTSSQNDKFLAGATAGSTAASGTVNAWDINGAPGSSRRLGIFSAGLLRWLFGGTGDAESGSNAGTDFAIDSYDDTTTTGTRVFLANLLTLKRVGDVFLGVVGRTITLRGRLVSGTSSATIAAGASASAASAAGNGANGTSGTVNATSSGGTGAIASVTYATAYAATPHVVITPQNAATQAAGIYVSARTASSFTVSCATAPSNGASLQFDYLVIG